MQKPVINKVKNPTYIFASDGEIHKISDTLIKQNLEAYKGLSK